MVILCFGNQYFCASSCPFTNTLPPGWESKTDKKTGKTFYINHFTKTTSWEDPRLKSVLFAKESPINLGQTADHVTTLHGSPDLRRNYVYPSQSSPIPAFQIPGQYSPKYIPLQDLRTNARMSPLLLKASQTQDSSLTYIPDVEDSAAKISSMFPTVSDTHIKLLLQKYRGKETVVISALQSEKHPMSVPGLLLKTSQTQDSSLTNIPDTEESVAKISSMFPTVSDTHIRLLLKKYHGREAVVISALQVEKHPITTPGPFATPPPARNIYPGLHSSLQMTPPLGLRSYSKGISSVTRFGSITTEASRIGDGYRNSSRPHSSPKLKLRYMKCIFPKAEETIILDVLTSSDNNIQKASEWLKKMGYEKRDPIKVQQQAEVELEKEKQENEASLKVETPHIPKIKSTEEKNAIKARLQDQYKDIIEQVIIIALDSVQYDENRANQILRIMMQEDNKTQSSSSSKIDEPEGEASASDTDLFAPECIPTSQSRQSFKNVLSFEKNDIKEKVSLSRTVEDREASFKSTLLTGPQGANPHIVKGADEKLLLTDYVPWQGRNLQLSEGPQKDLAKGSNKNNLSERKYKPIGPNPQLCKGAKLGLAKGSIFQQFRNIVNSESRGK
ncbi:hypothetical protein Trydic_g17226 [Trypoxylus dichotomus]